VRRALALAVLLLSACAAHGPAPAPAAPTPAAAPPAETPGPGGDANGPGPPPPGDPERVRAVERCRRAFADLAKQSAPPNAAEVWRACADVCREPCATAMRSPASDPATFASATARACRDTYCPRLPAPRPKLCAAAELPPPAELSSQWGELQARVWGLELGIEPSSLEPMFKSVVVPLKRDLPPPSTAPTVHVFAKPDGAGRVRVWIDGGKSVTVPVDAPGDAVAVLAREARAGAPADAQAILAIDRNLAYGVVVAIIDAFKRAGFARFALAVEPAPEKK